MIKRYNAQYISVVCMVEISRLSMSLCQKRKKWNFTSFWWIRYFQLWSGGGTLYFVPGIGLCFSGEVKSRSRGDHDFRRYIFHLSREAAQTVSIVIGRKYMKYAYFHGRVSAQIFGTHIVDEEEFHRENTRPNSRAAGCYHIGRYAWT